jgi:hypothetical protein
MEDINFSEPIVWINQRDRYKFDVKPHTEPAIDPIVSEIVGKPIKVNNPELFKLIVKWKKAKGDSDEPDNFFQDPAKIEELKRTL